MVGLEGVRGRVRPMVTCYPGDGARFAKHHDNDCAHGTEDSCNGRKLTAIVYLNPDWQPRHGGLLRIFNKSEGTHPSNITVKVNIAPVARRLVLFWSDMRIP